MGYKSLLYQNAAQAVTNLNDPTGLSRCFLCPSQAGTPSELLAAESWDPALYVVIFPGSSTTPKYTYYETGGVSYIFNEFVLGFNDTYGRLHGRANRVHQPSKTFFACDGIGDTGFSPARLETKPIVPPVGLYTLYNATPMSTPNQPNGGAVTMGDILSNNGLGGTVTCFDTRRHQKKINIAFCDGHVETRALTVSDLQNVFVTPP
jgi:prepilin-type processing-associated H-X9-DG protein